MNQPTTSMVPYGMMLIPLGIVCWIHTAGTSMEVAYGGISDPYVAYTYGLIAAAGLISGTWCFIEACQERDSTRSEITEACRERDSTRSEITEACQERDAAREEIARLTARLRQERNEVKTETKQTWTHAETQRLWALLTDAHGALDDANAEGDESSELATRIESLADDRDFYRGAWSKILDVLHPKHEPDDEFGADEVAAEVKALMTKEPHRD